MTANPQYYIIVVLLIENLTIFEMSIFKSEQKIRHLAGKLGISVSEFKKELDFLHINEIHIIDILPEMLIMVQSTMSHKTFSYNRKPSDIIEKGLMFSFHNILNLHLFDEGQEKQNSHVQPHVIIRPLDLENEILFPEGINIMHVTILIKLNYLKNFIGNDQNKFGYLFDAEKIFLIEEFLSPEIVDAVNEIINNSSMMILSEAYYKLKALHLLYLVFKGLSGRPDMAFQNLHVHEIEAVYRIRNKMADSLNHPLQQNELAAISGMNTLKIRKLFTQVFGKGIYEYYQYLRMQEAARLIQHHHLSVSEAGCKLGFSNISHFGRLFEKHFGMKPKKWALEYRLNRN